MATRQLKALTERGNHEIGNLNSLKVKTVAYGAICLEDIDNFTLVELAFNEDGERVCKQLTDVKNKSYLIASPEERNMGEELIDFYNGEGERARIVVLESGYTRFDTSAFSLNDGVTEIKAGQVAHFDPDTKKYIISEEITPHADYAGADKQFLVVFDEDDIDYTCGKALVRLETM